MNTMKWKFSPATRRGRVAGIGAVVASAALAAGGVVVVANGAGAAQSAPAAKSTRSQLIEMRTARNVGYFYTASQTEYVRAQKLGFTWTKQIPGYVENKAIRGTLPIYRLRYLSRPTYLLTLSAKERNSLAASGKWRYEGVVGRAAAAPAPGRVQVYRVSKSGVGWRVVRAASVKAHVQAGFRVDGRMGYLWTSK